MAPSSSNISLHFRDSRPGGSIGKVKYVGGPSAGLHTRRESEWAQGENSRLQAWLEKRATSCFHLCRPVLWGSTHWSSDYRDGLQLARRRKHLCCCINKAHVPVI